MPNVRKTGTLGTKRGQKCARCPEKWDTGNREGEREGERRREKEREGERRREKERGDKTIGRKREHLTQIQKNDEKVFLLGNDGRGGAGILQ